MIVKKYALQELMGTSWRFASSYEIDRNKIVQLMERRKVFNGFKKRIVTVRVEDAERSRPDEL